MRRLLEPWLRRQAARSPRSRQWYRRLFHPNGETWAAILKDAGIFHAMGEHCSIQTNVTITDPALVAMGDNVRMSGCTLFGHDGSVNMLNRAYGLRLDAVGPIKLGSDVFIGHGAIILPGTTIGSRVIVAAGAVVSRDVPDNTLVAGVPARPIRSVDEHVAVIQRRNDGYPWRHLIECREQAYDPALEPELLRQRIAHFFPEVQEDE